MNHYVIEVTAALPYPVMKQYREDATNISTATARAIKQYLKDVREMRKVVKSLSIKASRF